MKQSWKRIMAAAALTAALVGTVWAAGGTSDDPVISLSYLQQKFTPQLEADVQQATYDGLGTVYGDQLRAAVDSYAAVRLTAQKQQSAVLQKAEGVLLLKQGDVLTAAPGCKVTVKNGSLIADTSYLVDVTGGSVVTKYAALTPGHLYMMGDTSTGELKVQTATCEVTVNGSYSLSPSDSVDYGSRVRALEQMGLFLGTNTGFQLEATADRAQGLVMFLRLLGLEDEALAYTGSCPFTDVKDHWAERYVAYGYSQGLTGGTSPTTFSPNSKITCQQYATFLLRALGYTENEDFTYANAVNDLTDQGILTAAEARGLSSGDFARYKMAYLSFAGLFGVDQEQGGLLMNDLVDSGAVTRQQLAQGLAQVTGGKIS